MGRQILAVPGRLVMVSGGRFSRYARSVPWFRVRRSRTGTKVLVTQALYFQHGSRVAWRSVSSPSGSYSQIGSSISILVLLSKICLED